MNLGDKPSCVLCDLDEETPTTGPLSTKDEVTAHQNCLLYSSGIYCQNSPQYDDLFGFSVDDVREEIRRGNRLICSKCKKKGATAGCEVKRCKKSFHYPCAIKAQAKIIEDADNGKYGLYCFKHHEMMHGPLKNGSVNGLASSRPKRVNVSDASDVGSSKVWLYRDKRAPSQKSKAGDEPTGVDSNSSSSAPSTSSKRRLSFSDKQEEPPFKMKKSRRTSRILEDSSNSDENQAIADMHIFAPVESDSDEDTNCFPEQRTVPQFTRNHTESPTGSGNQLEGGDSNKDEDETFLHSDAESESLLLPVIVCNEDEELSATRAERSTQTSTADPRVFFKTEDGETGPDEDGAGPSVPSPSPDHSEPLSIAGSAPCSSPAAPPALTSEPKRGIDSAGFWKSCNTAGCTQAIFVDFITEMNSICGRIQSDQANQEEYDRALNVLAASGKLSELVAKQQKELQRKQRELEKLAAAMKEAISCIQMFDV